MSQAFHVINTPANNLEPEGDRIIGIAADKRISDTPHQLGQHSNNEVALVLRLVFASLFRDGGDGGISHDLREKGALCEQFGFVVARKVTHAQAEEFIGFLQKAIDGLNNINTTP